MAVQHDRGVTLPRRKAVIPAPRVAHLRQSPWRTEHALLLLLHAELSPCVRQFCVAAGRKCAGPEYCTSTTLAPTATCTEH